MKRSGGVVVAAALALLMVGAQGLLADGGTGDGERKLRTRLSGLKQVVEGMRALGFETLLPENLQAPIIVTFRMPAEKKFVFQDFYDRLKERGYVIYPGKLTVADSFRIGCIGLIVAGIVGLKWFSPAAE